MMVWSGEIFIAARQVNKQAALVSAIELVEHLIVAPASLLRWCSGGVTKHLMHAHTTSAISRRTCGARLIRRRGSSIVMIWTVMR